MSQRIRTPDVLNFETLICEKYMARLLENELKIRANPPSSNPKSRERNLKLSCVSPVNKSKTFSKTNSQSPKRCRSPKGLLEYSDDAALVKVTVKATNHRQRSRSRVIDQEPWGQILKLEKSNERLSIFNQFDPLRTLHFLIKELEFQLESVLPEGCNSTISQMVQDMQAALKRVPPEVASTIHLQQAMDKPENIRFKESATQTSNLNEENEHFKKALQENIIKFETKYVELENICTKLRNDKEDLAKLLLIEKDNVANSKKIIEKLENENNMLTPRIQSLEKEKEKLKSDLESLPDTYENRYSSLANDFRSKLSEMKTANIVSEQENTKLKHQLRVLNIEKEKHVTILSARDRQINEIRAEMTQLQEAVNEQLMELQKNALKTFSSNGNITEKAPSQQDRKENIGDWTVSASCSNEVQLTKHFLDKMNESYKDFPSGDIDVSDNFSELQGISQDRNNNSTNKKQEINIGPDKLDSHTSIRSLFNEVKKTALAVSAAPSYQLNIDNENKL